MFVFLPDVVFSSDAVFLSDIFLFLSDDAFLSNAGSRGPGARVGVGDIIIAPPLSGEPPLPI